MATKNCPTCGGDGFVAGCIKPDRNGTMRPTKETCGVCEGRGTVRVSNTRPL